MNLVGERDILLEELTDLQQGRLPVAADGVDTTPVDTRRAHVKSLSIRIREVSIDYAILLSLAHELDHGCDSWKSGIEPVRFELSIRHETREKEIAHILGWCEVNGNT